MNIETAVEILRAALSSYIEECSGQESEETQQIEEAFQVVKKELFDSDKQEAKK